ncbi:hypothetical protein BDP81DRAFT_402236 [Colletotrichum phormii]|uniref:Uncharacterized protein n=1 Tax=Colletotrichum phormii TaxID=359342 RepID=A0AAJ0A8D0_9PEZI|nr:uncharacterized protein BDP81DRAFT_402236 [Colletotrichum phormii]KAK1656410.1 hypothetical protein BDP81DRAFT_402236 [Colletotrichum phormii]
MTLGTKRREAIRRYMKSAATLGSFVQPAPSHDGAPTFASYKIHYDTPDSEAALQPLRPSFGTVICDTTHNTHLARSARLVRALFDRTLKMRMSSRNKPDRIEVVTLPLPQSFSDDQRAEACIHHHEDEYRNRLLIPDKVEAASWFLPEQFMDKRYARRILAINRFEDDTNDEAVVVSWEESLSNRDSLHEAVRNPSESRAGSYLSIYWQPRHESWHVVYGREYMPDTDPPLTYGPAKKRGLRTGYVWALEILLGMIVNTIDDANEWLTAVLEREDRRPKFGLRDLSLLVSSNTDVTDTLADSWRTSETSKKIERLLSVDEPADSLEDGEAFKKFESVSDWKSNSTASKGRAWAISREYN